MKVNNTTSKDISEVKSKTKAQDELRAKIEAKFGEIKKPGPKKIEDKVEISKKEAVKVQGEEGFGDLASNDPQSEETQEKLRGILQAGAFNFSDKERAALGEILKA